MKNRIIVILIGLFYLPLFAQEPTRVGTTAANFLEIGIGGQGAAMGDAQVALSRDMSAIYWNPAGLAFMNQNEVFVMHQPWLMDVVTTFVGAGLRIPSVGVIGIGVTQSGYGEMDVLTVAMPNGTGEKFSARDMAVALGYSRKLVDWFAFGATAKMVNSKIWHSSASALAVDLGVMINTQFFSPTGARDQGLVIGMSISNYGTRLKYDGIDLKQPIDIAPYEVGGFREEGNYKDAAGKFDLQSWELPLIFRVGLALHPVYTDYHQITITADALHPNNNTESVNVGMQYTLKVPTYGNFFLRGGYKALFMEKSEYGPTFGGGMLLRLRPGIAVQMDYAYRTLGILGNLHCYSFGFWF